MSKDKIEVVSSLAEAAPSDLESESNNSEELSNWLRNSLNFTEHSRQLEEFCQGLVNDQNHSKEESRDKLDYRSRGFKEFPSSFAMLRMLDYGNLEPEKVKEGKFSDLLEKFRDEKGQTLVHIAMNRRPDLMGYLVNVLRKSFEYECVFRTVEENSKQVSQGIWSPEGMIPPTDVLQAKVNEMMKEFLNLKNNDNKTAIDLAYDRLSEILSDAKLQWSEGFAEALKTGRNLDEIDCWGDNKGKIGAYVDAIRICRDIAKDDLDQITGPADSERFDKINTQIEEFERFEVEFQVVAGKVAKSSQHGAVVNQLFQNSDPSNREGSLDCKVAKSGDLQQGQQKPSGSPDVSESHSIKSSQNSCRLS